LHKDGSAFLGWDKALSNALPISFGSPRMKKKNKRKGYLNMSNDLKTALAKDKDVDNKLEYFENTRFLNNDTQMQS
jgi:hypothetical protein